MQWLDMEKSARAVSGSLTGPILVVLAGLCALRVWLSLNSPLLLLADASHDDGYFLSHAERIVSGSWRGGFSQYTLMKGPGYELFLAASAFSGLPVTATHGLFQLAATAIAAWAVARLCMSVSAGIWTFVLLSFIPLAFDTEVNRVLRDQIYWGQLLIAFTTCAVLMLATPKSNRARLFLGLVSGAMLGWAWLTREEGVALVPGFIVLVAGGTVWNVMAKISPQRQILSVLSLLMGFSFPVAGFATVNYLAYGKFVGVDYNESNFKAAIDALQSVEVGPHTDYVPVSKDVSAAAARHSPAFAPVEMSLRSGASLSTWEAPGCAIYPTTCGEIAGGWFVWALRDAAADNGYYRSPVVASERFGAVAREIEWACDSGALKCRSGLFSLIPPMSIEQREALPRKLLESLATASLWALNGDTQQYFSTGASEAIHRAWAFLNFPKILPPKVGERSIKGWYYDSASKEWPNFFVREGNGSLNPIQVERAASPDLVTHFSDPRAEANRFSATIRCDDHCSIVAKGSGDDMVEVAIDQKLSANSVQGTRNLFLDSIFESKFSYNRSSLHVAKSTQNILAFVYAYMMPALIATGFIFWLAAASKCIAARSLPSLLVASTAALTLIVTRLVVLAIVDATLFPAINKLYVLPIPYLSVVFSILSIWLVPHMRTVSASSSRPTAV